MGDIKLSVTFPVRKAKQGDQFLIYNTREFLCIYLDQVAFQAWEFMEQCGGVLHSQLIKLMIDSDVKRESDEELVADCTRLVDFLVNKGFLERIGNDEENK